MKKIFKGLFIFLFLILLSACGKDYKVITSSKFEETFREDSGYMLNDKSALVTDNYEKFIEASGKGIQYIYFEFETEKEAKKYAESFKEENSYKYKYGEDYIIVSNTKNGYFYLIQIDKTVILGNTNVKSNKKEIKNIFKKLGY